MSEPTCQPIDTTGMTAEEMAAASGMSLEAARGWVALRAWGAAAGLAAADGDGQVEALGDRREGDGV